MRNRILLAAIAGVLALSTACQPSTPPKEEPETHTPDPYLFSDSGLSYIGIGDSLTFAVLSVPDGQVKDTVFEQVTVGQTGDTNSFAWNVKVVTHNDGKLLLESDFETFMFLGRAQIESPRYHNAEGIHVGSTVAELSAAYPDLVVKPFAEYKVYEIVHGRQIFHIPMQGNVTDDTSVTIGQLPQQEKVVRIVLMMQ